MVVSQLREEFERQHTKQESDDGHGQQSDHLLCHQAHSQQTSGCSQCYILMSHGKVTAGVQNIVHCDNIQLSLTDHDENVFVANCTVI